MISDETEDSRDIKHNFCVNVQHRRKGWFYFRPLSQPWKNHRTFFCFPPLLFSSQLSSADKVTAAGSGWVLLEKPNVATSILDCQLSRQAAFHCGAPFALWWPWPITRCGENSLMSCLTSWGRCMEENNSYTMEDLISDVKVGSCLSSFDALPTVFMCVSTCVCVPLGSASVNNPISQVGHFQFVFGAGFASSLSLSTVFVDGLSLGWLWWYKWTSFSSSDDKWRL